MIRFDEPNEQIYKNIADLVKSLEKVDIDYICHQEERNLEDAIELDYSACLSKIQKIIKKDYDANIREAPNEPWGFDYAIEFIEPKAALQIMTRLFSKDDPTIGDIYYGIVVAKSPTGQYLIWDDT